MGHHKDADQRQHIADDRVPEGAADADVERPEADQRRADEGADRRDGGQDHHVVREQGAGVAGLALDHLPFGFRLQQDRFDTLDEVHVTPPLMWS